MNNKAYLKAISILLFTFLYCIMAALLFKIGTDNLFYDSEKILDRFSYNFEEEKSFSLFDSYTLSAYLYRALTFSQELNSNMLTSFRSGEINIVTFTFALQFTSVLYICIKLFNYAYQKNHAISFLAFFYMLFSTLYLLVPSKDFFIFVLAYATIFLNHKFRYLVYGYSLFRPFLLITLLISYATSKLTIKRTLILAVLITPLSLFVSIPAGLAKPVAFLSANTGIANLLPDTNMTFFFLNGAINSIRLLFPFELFMLELKHWLIALPKLALTIIFLYAFIKRKKTDSFIPFTLMLSFFYVQGLFEPDYGSALRHSFIILPLLIKMTPEKAK